MPHPISFPFNSSHCTWTFSSSPHEMLIPRPYFIKPFNFSQICSRNSRVNFGISPSNFSSRVSPVMAASTAATTQEPPVSTQDGSPQNSAPKPLQVNTIYFRFSSSCNLFGIGGDFGEDSIFVNCELSIKP